MVDKKVADILVGMSLIDLGFILSLPVWHFTHSIVRGLAVVPTVFVSGYLGWMWWSNKVSNL